MISNDAQIKTTERSEKCTSERLIVNEASPYIYHQAPNSLTSTGSIADLGRQPLYVDEPLFHGAKVSRKRVTAMLSVMSVELT